MPKKRAPTLTRLGNPYPRGLRAVRLDDGQNGAADLRLPAGEASQTGVVAGDYLYEAPDPKWPRLKLLLAPRGSRQSDEQYAAYRRDVEQCTNTHAMLLGLCRMLCTHLGNHLTCARRACRRDGCCAGIRDQRRHTLPLLVYPPCVPLDREIIETYRAEIVAEVKRVVARGNALQRPEAEPATAGRRLSGAPRAAPAAGNGGASARERKRPPTSSPVARPAKTA